MFVFPGKHLFRTQNVSEQNQKQFLCPGHKICVRNKCGARGQTAGETFVSATVCPHHLSPFGKFLKFWSNEKRPFFMQTFVFHRPCFYTEVLSLFQVRQRILDSDILSL